MFHPNFTKERILPLVAMLCLFVLVYSCHEQTEGIDGAVGDPPNNSENQIKEPVHSENIETSFIKGNIVYNHDKEMYLDEPNRYEVIVTCEMDKEKLVERIKAYKDTAKITIDKITIGDYVSVRLNDPEDKFKIKAYGEEQKKVMFHEDSTKYELRWQWDVVPQEEDSLKLVVEAWTKYKENRMDFPVYDSEISVRSKKKPLMETESVPEIKEETKSLPYGLFAIIGTLFAGLLFFLLRNKKKSAEYILQNISKEKKQVIQNMISDNRTKEAIEELMALKGDNHEVKNQLLILSARLKKINTEQNMNVIKPEEYNLELSKIRKAILEFLT